MTFRSPAESSPTSQQANGQLLDAMQKHVLDRAVPALDSALSDLDDYLFDRSQSGEETLGLIALREMRRARAQISQQFRQAVLNRFRRLRDRQPLAAGDEDGNNLSLLSDQDLEEQLAVEQLASSVLRTHAAAFEMVGKRFAVVAGQGELQPREIPLSPVFLAGALGKAMQQLEMDDDLRIVVFKFFERELTGVLGELYERCNALMATAGILPELRASNAGRTHRTPRAAASSAQPAHAAHAPQSEPHAHGEAMMQGNAVEQAAFANMLGMLQGWRTAVGMATPAEQAMPGTPLPTNDLMSILSLMQHDGGARFAPAGEAEQPLASQLRQQMVQNARKLGVSGDNLTLDGLDGDAVDLVALLFDVLLDGPQFDTQIRQMIGRMLVPYVKVAVKDRRMFLFKEHPARRLLNTVAEACEGNRGEAPQEREVLTHVDHTIDRLVAEFNEDVAIFETLEQELRAYMAQHRKRFELAEKRTAEAQRGRERLEQARSVVADDIDGRRGTRVLPPVIEDFLTRHASHHLVQLALRDGKGAPRYQEALRALDLLLAAYDQAAAGVAPEQVPPLAEDGMLAILSSAGCTEDAAQAALDALRDALARLAAGQSALENDVRMPPQADMPEPAPLPPEPQLEVVAGTAGLDFDGVMLERIRKLEVGDWIQLASAEHQFAPAKVSWISPISSRLLLVNRRGIRVLVASVEELAVMSKLGKVLLRDGATPFEDAMHQVVGRLQSATHRG